MLLLCVTFNIHLVILPNVMQCYVRDVLIVEVRWSGTVELCYRRFSLLCCWSCVVVTCGQLVCLASCLPIDIVTVHLH